MTNPLTEAAAWSLLLRIEEERQLESDPEYWRRRAAELLAARPSRRDYHGSGSCAAAVERNQRLTEDAERCLFHADLLEELASPHTIDPTITAGLVAAADQSVVDAVAELSDAMSRQAQPTLLAHRLAEVERANDRRRVATDRMIAAHRSGADNRPGAAA